MKNEPSFQRTLKHLAINNSQFRDLNNERDALIQQLKVDQRELPPGWEREFDECVLATLGEDGAEAFWLSVSLNNKVA